MLRDKSGGGFTSSGYESFLLKTTTTTIVQSSSEYTHGVSKKVLQVYRNLLKKNAEISMVLCVNVTFIRQKFL